MVLVDDQIGDFDLEAALAALPAWRRAQALRFRFERDRRLSVAAYRLLARALAEEFGIPAVPEFAYGPNGKPYLPAHPGIHFNLSHCARAAACIVSRRPVGIDVEEIAPVDDEVMRSVLSAEERRAVLGDASPETAFARYWTMKEAVLKLEGTGIGDGRLPSILARRADLLVRTEVHADRGYVLSFAQTAR